MTAGAVNMLAAEVTRLKGENEVLVRWISEALPCIEVCDALMESDEDGGEAARLLVARGKALVDARLPKTPAAGAGPVCNLRTPWLEPG